MAATVYIETTIIGYLTARPSRDLIVAAHQQLTPEWWERRRVEYGLFASPLVLREAGSGDVQQAQRRLEMLRELPVIAINDDAVALARALIDDGAVPEKAAEDALHIALATVHGMDYLLTWNCRHIANAEMRGRIEAVCLDRGYEPPIICTPEELMGD